MNERIAIDLHSCGDDPRVRRQGVGFVEIRSASRGSLDGPEQPVITGNTDRIGDHDETNGQQIPKAGRREEKTRLPLCTGPAADELIEVAKLVSLVAQNLPDPVSHQHILWVRDVPGVNIEVEYAEGLWLGAQPRHDRIRSIQALVRRIRVSPKPLPVPP